MAVRVVGLAVSVVVLLGALFAAPIPEAAGDPAPGTSRRIGESTDVGQAAIEISQETFGDGEAGAVVLGRDDLFADSLAGSALAGAVFAPILYTTGGDSAPLDAATAAEIQRVLPSGECVYVLGSFVAVSQQAEDDLIDLGYCVFRIGGSNRLETAAFIAQVVDIRIGESPTVLVARADEWADALTGGAYAAAFGVPLVLNPSDSSSAELFAYLDARSTVAEVILLGGTAAIEDQVAADIEQSGYGVRRVAGATRTDTAVAIAEELWGSGQSGVTLVNGFVDNGWAYALAAAVPASIEGAPELYAGDELPDATAEYLDALQGCEFAITAGPTSLVAESIADRADEACGGTPEPTPSSSPRPTPPPSPAPSPSPSPSPSEEPEFFPVFLSDQQSVERSEFVWDVGSANINGQVFSNTVYRENTSEGREDFIDYDLGRDYEEFRTTIGLLDSSADGSRTQFDVFVDGVNVASHQLGLGESVPLSIDVTGKLRLRLAVTNLVDVASDNPAFGNARLLAAGVADDPQNSSGLDDAPDSGAYFLSEQQSVQRSEFIWDMGSANINGQVFANTVYRENTSEGRADFIDYDLGRDYEEFKTTIGLLDSSADGSRAQFDVFVDGVNVASHELGLGESVPLSVDVTGKLRLRLQVTNLADVDSENAGFGDAAIVNE